MAVRRGSIARSTISWTSSITSTLAGRTRWQVGPPGWQRRFAPLARRAFERRVDLHQQSAVIDQLASVYERMQKEAQAAGLASAN
jgi:hypothetical protein